MGSLPAPGEPDEFPLDNEKLSIVFVGTEVSPWAKTGGLGDVMRDLPSELAARGHRVMTVSPRYDQYAEAWDTSTAIDVAVGKGRQERVNFFHSFHNGVDRVFVDHPCFLEKVWGFTGSKIYGPKAGVDYPDGPMRWAILCQAALEAPLKLHLGGYPYGQDVLFVPNDWHAALLPLYLKAYYQPMGEYTNAHTMFILHNIVFQGRYPVEYFDDLNLPKEFFDDLAFESCFCSPPLDGASDDPVVTKAPMKMINILKAGLVHSDRLVTVSPTFAEEVMSGKKEGVELDDIIRARGMIGILNGMDMMKWNPKTDKFLQPGYDAATAWVVKRKLKVKLQAELGLTVDADAPLVGFVGRLDPQKGIDLLMEAIPELINSLPQVQFVLLGTGQPTMMRRVKEIEAMDPERIAGITKFTETMEHKLTGAADFFALPSRFEPCGLVQLHAMRYGTVPIVTSTGGLKDSVLEGVTGYYIDPIPTEDYPGMKLSPAKLELGVQNVIDGVTKAVTAYGTEEYRKLQTTAMNMDLTWTQGVQKYEREIANTIAEGRGPLSKNEAQLVRAARNGGIKSSYREGVSAESLPYPWSPDAITVEEGLGQRKPIQSSKSLPIRENSAVPTGGPISTILPEIRGGATDNKNKGGAPKAPEAPKAPAASPYGGDDVAGPSGPAAEDDGQKFVGLFKKVDASKPVATNPQKDAPPTNYSSKQVAPGTKIDGKPHAQTEVSGSATGALSKISLHDRPPPQTTEPTKKGAEGA